MASGEKFPEGPSSRPGYRDSELPTKPKNVTASMYQSLLITFDSLSDEQRMVLADVISAFSSFDEDSLTSLAELMRVYPSLSPGDRKHLLETAVRLALGGPV